MDELPCEISDIICQNLTFSSFAKILAITPVLVERIKFRNISDVQMFFYNISPEFLTKLLRNRYIEKTNLEYILESSIQRKNEKNIEILIDDGRLMRNKLSVVGRKLFRFGSQKILTKLHSKFGNSVMGDILIGACACGDSNIFVLYFSKYTGYSADFIFALLLNACRGGNLNIIDFLLKIPIIGPLYRKMEEKLMASACMRNNYHIIKRLLKDERYKMYFNNVHPREFVNSDILKWLIKDNEVDLPYKVMVDDDIELCELIIRSVKFDIKKCPKSFTLTITKGGRKGEDHLRLIKLLFDLKKITREFCMQMISSITLKLETLFLDDYENVRVERAVKFRGKIIELILSNSTWDLNTHGISELAAKWNIPEFSQILEKYSKKCKN